LRKTVAAIAVGLLAAGLITSCSPSPERPVVLRTALQRELAQPASSVWSQALRPGAAAADLEQYQQAPVNRASLEYDPAHRTLTGKQEILYTNRLDHPLPTLYLQSTALSFGESSDGADAFALSDLQVNGKSAAHTLDKTAVAVTLPKPLAPWATVHLAFSFRARVPMFHMPDQVQWLSGSNNLGYYGALDNQTHGLTGVVAVVKPDTKTHEPEYSLWDVSVTLPSPWNVISSGVSVGEPTAAGDRQTTRIVSVSYSLALFAEWGLQSDTQDVDGVKVTIHYGGTVGSLGPEILGEAAQLLKVEQALLGPYPFPELDLLPLPLAADGMNRSGLIMLNRVYLTDAPRRVADSVTDPWLRRVRAVDMGEQRRSVLAHELAHSWWGDLVWPDETRGAPAWLEGISEATAIAVMEQSEGTAAAQAMRERETYSYQVRRASGFPDVASGLPAPEGVSKAEYFAMSYNKPALFYDQVRRQVGNDAFFAAMRQYLAEHRWRVQTGAGPIEQLLGDAQVVALYQRWMLETHGDEDLGLLTPEQLQQVGMRR
jgi:hypothetical protein